jgi:diguanylate cyclase (GGDEF)-like protein/PAS domain S-box-containing protein
MQLLRRYRKPGLAPVTARDLLFQYGVAIGASVLAIALWRILLKPAEPNPYPLLLAAVAVSAVFGGLGPGLLSIGITAITAYVYYVNTKTGLRLPTLQRGLELDLYILIAIVLNWLISVNRRAQMEMRAQLKVSANITRNLGEGVYAVDQQGYLTFMNPAAEKLLGWTEGELRGRNVHTMIHDCKDGVNRDGEQCPLPEILRAGNTVHNDDDVFKKRDRSTLPISYTCSPVLTDGRITGAVLTFRDISDRKRAVEAMRASEERYRILVDTSHDSIWLTDLYGYIIMSNDRAAKLYGYHTTNEMLGMNASELIVPEDRLRSVQDRRKTAEEGGVVSGDYLSQRRDGPAFPSEISYSLVMDDEDKPRAILHVARDITERKKSQELLQSSESRLSMQYAATAALAQSATLSEAIPRLLSTICETAGWDVGSFWTVDTHDNVLRCRNVTHATHIKVAGFRKLTQQLTFAPGVDLPGRVWQSGRPVWVPDVMNDDNFPRALMASKEGLHGAFAFPIVIGNTVHSIMEFFSFQPMKPSDDMETSANTIATVVGQFMERKQAEESLEYHAMHDSLTDLPNRTLLHDRLELAIASAQRNSKPLCLMIMDLDRFKEINDAFGHRVGDLILRQIGPRIKGALRESDTVGRLGGDEFAMILPASDIAGATTAAPKILGALAQPVVAEGQNFDIAASIGVAVYPEHGQDVSTLFRRADVAMYVAKRSSAGFAIYDTEKDDYSPSRLALKADLRQAIENDEFILHYQPKVDLDNGKIDSVEALVRWQHPQHGLIGPDQFIELADQNGLIQLLSLQILGAALRQCHSWQQIGLDLRVAVNFTTSSLQDQQLVGMISGMLKACEVTADHLEVEITETAIMSNPDRATEVLERLHDLGVHISIDDFGTGHSSLAQLKRLQADQIKIDHSIVSDMATNDEDSFITRSVIDLGHKLGMRVVAEGVENQETADILATLGCDLAQGSYISQPIAPEEIARRFRGPDPRLSSVG